MFVNNINSRRKTRYNRNELYEERVREKRTRKIRAIEEDAREEERDSFLEP